MKKVTLFISAIIIFLTALDNTKAQQTTTKINISPEIGTISKSTGFVQFNSELKTAPENIFRENYRSFGISRPEDMKLYRTERDKLGMSHYRFQQQYKNIPILGAEFIIHERAGSQLTGNGLIIPDFKMNLTPSLSSSNALTISMNEVGARSYMWQEPKNEEVIKEILKDPQATFYPKPQLVIIGPNVFPELKEYKLVYGTKVYAMEPLSLYTVFVDAQSGEVLVKYNDMHHRNALGRAITMYADTVELTTDHFQGGFRLQETRNGVSIRTLDANNQFGMGNVSDFTDTDNFWNNVNDRIDQTATDAHWGTEMTYDYFHEVHNRNSIDDNGMDLLSLVHVGTNWYNASWNGVYMSYGDGTGNPLTLLAIVSHELTHGVTQHTAGLIYYAESGALNESFSDIFGVAAMYWAGVTNPDGTMRWDIIFRDLADPNRTRQPDTYHGRYWNFGSSDNAGVHTNSQVQNHWFYLLCEGGSGVNDNEHEYDVTPIGIEKAEQIAYRTLSYYLNQGSDYSEARNATLQATEDLYGMCSDEYKAVANAWFAVGVGSPVHDKDVGITAVLSPATSCEYLGKEEPLTFELRYFGACETLSSSNNIPIKFSVNAGDTLSEIISLKKNLDGGETATYTTKAVFDFSKAGMHNINVWTEFPADTNLINNQKNVNIYSGYQYAKSNDITLVRVISPKTSCSNSGSEEVCEVEIMNNGCTVIPKGESLELAYNLDGNEVRENLILAEDWESKDKLTYKFNETLDISTPDIYDFVVEVNYSKDPTKSNNTFTDQIISGVLSALPYFEDFEEGPGGWTSKAVYNTDNWEWGVPKQILIDTASSGIYAWMTDLDANHADASEMVLMSPCFDFSELEHPQVCFDAIFKFENDFDGMVLEYSKDNESWSRVEVPGYNSYLAQTVNFGVPWFSRTNNNWTKYCTYVPEVGGEPMVRFRFRVGSDANKNDEGAAIDNFEIKTMTEFDLVMQSVDSPASNCSLTDEEEVSVTIKNMGSESILSFDLNYSINGGPNVTESIEDTLQYNEPYEYTFKQGADLSTPGENYSIKASISFGKDQNTSNNNRTVSVTHLEQQSIPYAEDFEEGELPDEWQNKATGNSKGWAFSDAETENALSGGNSWPIPEHTKFAVVNDISINYNRRNDQLITPPLDLTSAVNPALYFEVFYSDLLSSRALIEVSTDNGTTWTVIDSCNPVPDYWRQEIVSLKNYAGESCVRLGFRFDDAGVKSTGIAVDNIRVGELPAKDCAVMGVYLSGGSKYTDKENLVVELKNEGTSAFDNSILTIIYEEKGKTPVKFTEPLGRTIEPGKTLLHSISRQLDFSGTGEYFVTVSQYLIGDNNFSNDTLPTKKIETGLTISEFPHKETFDKFSNGQPGTFINGWVNNGPDEIDWWVHSGSTPTGNTGPTSNHTSGNGKYLYVESSYPFHNMTADLYSPVFDVSSLQIPYLKFWYHMLSNNGAAGDVMGTLSVDVYDGKWHNDFWTLSGNQGSSWLMADLNLRDFGDVIKLRFRGLTGPAQFSDIAIDDFEIYDKQKQTDIAITKLPKNGCGMTDGTDITIGIINNGTEHIPGFEVSYSLDDGSFIKETYNEILKSGDEILYTFKNIVLPKGNRYFDFIVNAAGDEDRSNDTVYNHRVISYTDIFSYDEVTVCEGIWAIVSANHINGYDSFAWEHDASAGKILYADSIGMYTISFDFENGCTLTDSVFVNVLPAPSTGLKDVQIPEPTMLDAGEFESYLWQDGSTERTFKVTEDGLYFVTVSNKDGCYGTDGFEVKIVSSADENNDNTLSVYPNPVSNILNVSLYNPNGIPVAIEIISLDGRIVYSDMKQGVNLNLSIDTKEFPSGVYLIKFRAGSTIKVRKIVKE